MGESVPATGVLRDVVLDVITAIGDELSALASDTSSAIHIRNGRLVGAAGPDRLWSFEFDGGLPVPPETPARLTVPDRDPVQVTILAVGDLDLLLGVRPELGEAVPYARLSAEPWFVYDRLRSRLESMLETGTDLRLFEQLLDLGPDDEPRARGANSGLSQLALEQLGPDQVAAVQLATKPGLRFVWGPPGTGKTNTLAATVRSLVEPLARRPADDDQAEALGLVADSPQRVLVTAHANAAVDVAMARVADLIEGTESLAAGRILRIGTPQLAVVRDRPEVLPDEIIARQQPDLVHEQEELRYERRLLSTALKDADSNAERADLTRRLEEVRAREAQNEGKLREARRALFESAEVIGATLSKLTLHDLLWTWPATTVIVDEASMAGLPFLVALAMRGAATLACYGDFRQLPPIGLAETAAAKTWMARDVFELAGVVQRIKDGEPDARLAALRTQYRMGEPIAEVVSELAYFGMLRTDPVAGERAKFIGALDPAAGHQIVIVDTSAMTPACQIDADPHSYSRFNPMHAAVVAEVARRLVDEGAQDVGVVTPYRAQARLFAALTREERAITAATTHKFQGSERDAIVIDLTDADPQEGASLLTGRDPELALRLLNVAASRARGKLVIVADLAFLDARHAITSPARRLLDLARAGGAPMVPATEVVGRDTSNATTWFVSWDEAVMAADVVHATSIDVSVPGESFAGPWLMEVASHGGDRRHTVVVRAPTPVALSLEDTDADLRLRTLGVTPFVFLDDDILITGGTHADRPAIRIESPAIVAAMRRLVAPTG